MPSRKSRNSIRLYAVAAAVLAIAAAIVAVIYLSLPTSFATFRNAFISAPQVAIFARYNGTVLGAGGSSAVGCALQIIERLHGVTVNFFQANQTSCTYAKIPGNVSNYTVVGLDACLDLSRGMPAVFLNYSSRDVTTVTPTRLYVSGDLVFLRQCGIAPLLGG